MKINDKVLGIKELYSGSSGTSSCTLSDDASNYTYLDIYYTWSTSFGVCSRRVYIPSGYTVNLSQIVANNSNIYVASSVWSISGTTITCDSGEYWRWSSGGTATRTQSNQIQIIKVIGYV